MILAIARIATVPDSRLRGAWPCPLLNPISLPIPLPFPPSPSYSPFASTSASTSPFAFAVAISCAHARNRWPVSTPALSLPSAVTHEPFPFPIPHSPFRISHPPPTRNRPRRLVAAFAPKSNVDCRIPCWNVVWMLCLRLRLCASSNIRAGVVRGQLAIGDWRSKY